MDEGNDNPRVIIRKLRDVPGLKVDYGILLLSMRRSRNFRFKYIDFDRLLWNIGLFSYENFPYSFTCKPSKLIASSIFTFALKGLLEENNDKNNNSNLDLSLSATKKLLRRLAVSGRIASRLPNLDLFIDLKREIASGNNLFYSSKKTRNLTTSFLNDSSNCNNRLTIVDISKLSLAYRCKPPSFISYVPLEKCPIKKYPSSKYMNYEYFKDTLYKKVDIFLYKLYKNEY